MQSWKECLFLEVNSLQDKDSYSQKKQDQPYQDESDKMAKYFDFPDANRVAIAGTLLNDPPLRRTRRGIPVTNFIIATSPEKGVNVPEGMVRENCQVSVVVWSQQAVECSRYLRKGSAVLIMGELQSMPNFAPKKDFFPVQINAQWIQYLEKGAPIDVNAGAFAGDSVHSGKEGEDQDQGIQQ